MYAARWRPLAEQGRESVPSNNPKGRATWKFAPLSFDKLPAAIERAREKLADKPERIAELEALGRERALVYKTLVLTGLRRGELASLTVGSLSLDSAIPSLVLEAGNAKNRQAAEIPLRSDLASELAEWVNDKASVLQQMTDTPRTVLSIDSARTAQLPTDTPLFPSVTSQLIKVLDRDLAAASIDKRDNRGRTVDVHALRHTYASLLSAGGVTPRTAQAALRHSSIDLTMNAYTDPRVLDVAGALDSLPALPLDAKHVEHKQNVATGTHNTRAMEQPGLHQLAPTLAPKSDKRSKLVTTADNWASCDDSTEAKENPEKQNVSRGFSERRRADSNRRCRICNPMP